jgi:adenylate kinase
MILVTGVSSSGKTHTLERLVHAKPRFRHIRASEILRSLDRPTIGLTIESALANQRVLAAELYRLGLQADEDAMLDGHATVETTTGILPLPDETFERLAPQAIVHIEADPVSIAERSALRGQPYSPREVANRQKLEREHARTQASRLGIPFHEVASGDVDALLRCVPVRKREPAVKGGPIPGRRGGAKSGHWQRAA